MRHINFIETKPIIELKRGKFELNYLNMVFVAVGVLAVFLMIYSWQRYQRSQYEAELAFLQKSLEDQKAPEQALPKMVGVEWSKLLHQSMSEFPEYIRLQRITGSTKDKKRLVFQMTGQTVKDVSRAKKNLIQTKICEQVELNKIDQTEEQVNFELECQVL